MDSNGENGDYDTELESTVIVVNFAHPFSTEQRAQIANHARGEQVQAKAEAKVRVVDMPAQFDLQAPLPPQVVDLFERVPLTLAEWSSPALRVNLPGYAPAAALLIAEIHGRTGHFPSILHVHVVQGADEPRYQVGRPINLQQARDKARERRIRG